MRLDEWQKYLDAQFVVEEQAAKTGSLPNGKTATEQMPDDKKLRLAPLALDDSAWVVETPPTQETPSRTSLHQEPSRPQPMEDPALLSADIPPFERYLPASHAAVQVEALLPPTRTPVPHEETVTSKPDSSDLPIGAFSILMPIRPQAPVPPPPILPESENPQLDEPESMPRRTPRSRTRHARNVRPEPVPSALSAAELWSTVPKHVQTLLALGRMEEREEEVAQSSYKRPFQETRQELIERLLNPILSLEDTARLLNVCPTTVRRYTNRGILTHYRKEPDRPSTGGNSDKETRQRRFRLSDILAFLETQHVAIEADRQAEVLSNTQKEAG